MLSKPFLYFLAKIVAVITSYVLLNSANVDITFAVISALSFACIFVLEILLNHVYRNNKLIIMTTTISLIACFALGLVTFFPLYIILLTHIIDISIDKKMFYQIQIVVVILSLFIFNPGISSIVIALVLNVMLLFSRAILTKLDIYIERNYEQKETISELSKKIIDLKSLTKTLKYTASVEERNRIAARIHDQIGHGISGSIIMLEAAMLIMKDNPDKAISSIQKATINLRDGVDDIRAALREERAGRYLLGMNDVTAMLEEFKVSYNRAATLKTTGDLDIITIDIWTCIHDNLKECLTNVLKHSSATEFHLNIDVYKKIIKVEYKDNGKSEGVFKKGLGLEAIEERTVSSKGRCFFAKGENGFSVTNIFTY